jgi:hypothetical protein
MTTAATVPPFGETSASIGDHIIVVVNNIVGGHCRSTLIE